MKVAVFSTKAYDRRFLEISNRTHGHELTYLEPRLMPETASLAEGFDAVCVFVHDRVDETVMRRIQRYGVRLVALRCAGYNNVDLAAAAEKGITVVRVPAYSPYAVAEHTIGLMLTLNRKFHRAHARIREGNFALEGLMGFDMHGRTAGVIGTGKIGFIVARILRGFGCEVLAYDPYPNLEMENYGIQRVSLEELYRRSDIITLHCPLTEETYHLIDERAVEQMKPGVMIVNTSRGALVDTVAAVEGLKSEKIGYLGLDVYEEEEGIFYEDKSSAVLKDDVFARLLTFPNVIITGHQAYFTRNAMENIADTTMQNITDFERDGKCGNEVKAERKAVTSQP